MLEILKIHENVVFGLRKWPPKNVPEHEFSKISFFPHEKCNSPSLEKKHVFCMAGASRGPFGTEKKWHTMTSPGESEFRGLNA